ncbi:Glucosamine-phosphate N-acetyltransferase-like protein [Coemansia sp. RSA 2399]|nr:Glucosamine-phosphate N-acetyltransferase-like protein [Coemansia sp. RSA 2399]
MQQDFSKGYMDCLADLTFTNRVTEDMFAHNFEKMRSLGCYYIVVIECIATRSIVASGTLLVEEKFIRDCCRVGHIEDIVVREAHQDKHFGTAVVRQLIELAGKAGCNKCILDCDGKTVPFYAKCGFEAKGRIQMSKAIT